MYLSIGSKVMLHRNICVSKGFVNSTIGTVQDIIYKDDERPPNLLRVIFIDFDIDFTSPSLKDRLFTLTASTATWRVGGLQCSRKQFPIVLAYALTIHKSQGLTLDKTIVDIGAKKLAAGLTYFGLSRVEGLKT